MKKILGFIVILSLVFQGCDDKEQSAKGLRGFSNEVLENWAENIIYPSFKNYQQKAQELTQVAKNFEASADVATLDLFKDKWLDAYKAYQQTIIFDVLIVEGSDYIDLANSYPIVAYQELRTANNRLIGFVGIDQNIKLISEGKKNEIFLDKDIVTTRYHYQGFPALDYLLFSKDLAYFQNNESARIYMGMLAEALERQVNRVVTFWEENKQKVATSTDQSITGIYSKLVNAFVRVYEAQIRAKKVGYACGAIPNQNGIPEVDHIEAYYNPDPKVSKELLKIALQSSQDFFNGKHFGSNKEGKSLKSTLVELGRGQLVKDIQNQYKEVFEELNKIPETESLRELALKGENIKDSKGRPLYPLFLAMQKNVGNLKTRMLREALNAQVDYSDGDGD